MKLEELKRLLSENSGKQFRLKLPDEKSVPQCFHITEVGLVTKTFIDCGGKTHTSQTCQLQAWIGPDVDHRIEAGKMVRILKISQSIVPDDSVPVEIEYEDTVLSQYPVSGVEVTEDAVTLLLALKHTDCLAKELCLPQSSGGECGQGGGCCC